MTSELLRHGPHHIVLVGSPEFCLWGPVTNHPFSLSYTQRKTGVFLRPSPSLHIPALCQALASAR